MARIVLVPPLNQKVVLTSLGCGILLYVLALFLYRLTIHPLARYPGPLLGKLTTWYGVYHALVGDMHLDIQRCHEEYGTFVRYGPNALVVNGKESFHDIYGPMKKVKKAKSYMVHGPGNIIGIQDKKAFARKKRILGQGFSDAALREHEPKVLEHIKSFCEKVSDVEFESEESRQWSTARKMTLWCNYLTTDIISKVVFSTSWNLLDSPKNRGIVKTLSTIVHLIGAAHQSAWLYRWRLTIVLFPHLIWSAVSLDSYTIDAMTKSKEARRKDPTIQDVFGQLINATDPESESGLPLQFDDVRLNSGTLIVAGSDTSSSALSATFFYLSRHPDAYAKVAHEVRTKFTSHYAIRSGLLLNSCQYLRAAINEAMRLSPVVTQPLWREVEKGGAIIAGQYIPAGFNVGSGIYSLHHDPVAFPNPFKYDIERWIIHDGADEEREKEAERIRQMQRSFAPFSAGPRQCLAKNFAVMELLLTMANVFYRLDFKAAVGEQGRLGEGALGLGYGRERRDEFQLKSYFTSHMEGPMILFKRRDAI